MVMSRDPKKGVGSIEMSDTFKRLCLKQWEAITVDFCIKIKYTTHSDQERNNEQM